MECYCYLRNIQDLLFDGKTPHERRIGDSFERPIIPFGSVVEYHPISAKDLLRLHQFGNKVLPGFSPWLCIAHRCNLEKRHFGRGHCGIGKDGRIRNPHLETQCKGSVNAHEW